ncbi:MAG: 3-oxoacyl-[acyl-carrier-protein] reductase [Acidobacteriia bacterium]|nr:3-oxoacyl-[acyl-carrier-protein] reductase [Terriglobia bacterium]MYG03489.1 3-oxoacyl-[acyl-carrier-protein] reductase [Terriglobia bacterium]MYK09423.1 3-oxoacyl-[acyl-carrier-protein] reductase [Terriglobia bacterium]
MTHHTALVTGASQGIGRACAKALAANEVSVIAGARQTDKLAALVEEIRAAGGTAEAVELDVTDQASVDAMAKSHGRDIDILVNNAGITADNLGLRLRDTDWQSVLDTNLTGAFRCSRALMRGMMKKRWGRIVNVSSVVALSGNAGQANYSASKAGLIGLTKSLAQELASRKITVNAVAPGFFATDMTARLDEAQQADILTSIPMGRMGELDELAAAICFLASEEAGYITGHVLNVSGGLYM